MRIELIGMASAQRKGVMTPKKDRPSTMAL
jgi:hypothetical protein